MAKTKRKHAVNNRRSHKLRGITVFGVILMLFVGIFMVGVGVLFYVIGSNRVDISQTILAPLAPEQSQSNTTSQPSQPQDITETNTMTQQQSPEPIVSSGGNDMSVPAAQTPPEFIPTPERPFAACDGSWIPARTVKPETPILSDLEGGEVIYIIIEKGTEIKAQCQTDSRVWVALGDLLQGSMALSDIEKI